MYVSCEEHIDLAMDIIIDEHEAAPVIEMIPAKEQLSTSCSFCEKPANYRISK
ncbi:CxxH/CxxC protein [Halalkalibacterium ligniniphilum]|uniref:CxxH/CxxC protein n=1 Tax=Halalkalibacterium ligniniphilum TaxID=1134413 RepID=UPI0003458F45|nr:CxxH/CxxC protein [Halalkalibacterium ligniniphilum]